MVDFETHSSGLELGNIAHLLLLSMISAAMPQTSRDINPNIVVIQYINCANQGGVNLGQLCETRVVAHRESSLTGMWRQPR
jgi:hypothetical protein